MARLFLMSVSLLAQGPAVAPDRPMPQTPHPIVIAHRGASGERPEHTRLSYELAIEQGADFIEPDLVPTSDGVLVARHENNIADTTDIAAHPEFAGRRTTRTIDGDQVTGWFTEDFTLAELKTLRARERLPLLRPANRRYDGQAQILTLAEVIAIAKAGGRRTGRTIGIYPETKHPSYFAAIGLPLEARLVEGLEQAGWNRADAPVFIQSFEVNNLRKLKGLTPVRLIQLMAPAGAPADGGPAYSSMASAAGLKAVAAYADGVGPELTMVASASTRCSTLVADAHAAGLKVHPWTLRAENHFLPPAYRVAGTPATHGDLDAAIRALIGLGVDGFFTDYPALGVSARSSPRLPAHPEGADPCVR